MNRYAHLHQWAPAQLAGLRITLALWATAAGARSKPSLATSQTRVNRRHPTPGDTRPNRRGSRQPGIDVSRPCLPAVKDGSRHGLRGWHVATVWASLRLSRSTTRPSETRSIGRRDRATRAGAWSRTSGAYPPGRLTSDVAHQLLRRAGAENGPPVSPHSLTC